jgi:hypothetical protein
LLVVVIRDAVLFSLWRRNCVFRRVRIVREKRSLPLSCPSFSSVSVCPHVSARPSLDGFPWNFILETYESIKKIQFWLKSDKNIGQFT